MTTRKKRPLYKRLRRKLARFTQRHPFVLPAIGLGIIIAVVVIIIVSCTAGKTPAGTGKQVSEPIMEKANVLEDSGWKTDAEGRKYYDKPGFVSEHGIDISQWAEEVDFNAIKGAGVEFVILRAGYRGYLYGKIVGDDNLATYLNDAAEAGLKIGIYFVTQAKDTKEAVEEAEYVLKQVKGYDIAMPVYIDVEPAVEEARTDSLSTEERTEIVKAFCDRIEEAGLRGGIYANEVWFTDHLNLNELQQYDIWKAKYLETPGNIFAINMWQYSETGFLPGCDMNVDLNVRVRAE
ncbi:MAG: hypothetical protein HUJ75_05135 [Parasporobacterium sp.]|nr:hypothetical protein [Parasporobacterium sp.]